MPCNVVPFPKHPGSLLVMGSAAVYMSSITCQYLFAAFLPATRELDSHLVLALTHIDPNREECSNDFQIRPTVIGERKRSESAFACRRERNHQLVRQANTHRDSRRDVEAKLGDGALCHGFGPDAPFPEPGADFASVLRFE